MDDAFIIDFNYQGTAYTGLVTPKTNDVQEGYTVKLESENQDLFLDIVAKPCGEDKMEWCFMDNSAGGEYDKDFLQEIGEAIEKYQSGL